MRKGKGDIEIRPRIRVIRNGDVLLGPGKADLLAAIDRVGSIRQAAAELGMSYMRAWTLVKTMNEGFSMPLVESTRGGSGHGGAHLTTTGRDVLELYHQMQEEALASMDAARKRLERLLK